MPAYVREVVEEVAFQARTDPKIDKRSGVSQRLPISCLENVVSNAERRALAAGETTVVPRVADIYAAHAVDHRQVRARVRRRAARRRHGREGSDSRGRAQRLDRLLPRRRRASDRALVRERRLAADERRHARRRTCVDRTREVQGLHELAERVGVARHVVRRRQLASAIDFALEALCAQKKISRSDDWRYSGRRTAAASRRPTPRAAARSEAMDEDDELPFRGPGKKKYYN